jgi:hypothetical protein
MKKKFEVVKTYVVDVDIPENIIEDGCIRRGVSSIVSGLINQTLDEQKVGVCHMKWTELTDERIQELVFQQKNS